MGDLVTLYTGIKPNSWAGKISDNWEGLYIIHQVHKKGSYTIKEYKTDNPRVKIIHGNRLKLYHIPDVFYNNQMMKAWGAHLY
jgi:hypothetical protein